MKKYNQLTQDQRYHIAALNKTGATQANIGFAVGVHKSTVSRELRRNLGLKGYSPKQAHALSDERRSAATKRIKMTSALIRKIEAYLRQDWSPDQISGYLYRTEGLSISHERVYQYVLEDKKSGGTLYQHLRHSNKKRKKRYGSHDRRGQLKNRISIDERPKIVDKKTRIGDWEIDTVIGKNHKGALVTIVDRVSKVTVIEKVATKHADGVTAATIKGLLPYIVHSITGDNVLSLESIAIYVPPGGMGKHPRLQANTLVFLGHDVSQRISFNL